ncbi:MAG: hypothetical protein LC624_03425 [Halobacteriales archaeon]|nr:hypothetical protein [Halobacteriales archaeon]
MRAVLVGVLALSLILVTVSPLAAATAPPGRGCHLHTAPLPDAVTGFVDCVVACANAVDVEGFLSGGPLCPGVSN